jgi:hypothetical protein
MGLRRSDITPETCFIHAEYAMGGIVETPDLLGVKCVIDHFFTGHP